MSVLLEYTFKGVPYAVKSFKVKVLLAILLMYSHRWNVDGPRCSLCWVYWVHTVTSKVPMHVHK